MKSYSLFKFFIFFLLILSLQINYVYINAQLKTDFTVCDKGLTEYKDIIELPPILQNILAGINFLVDESNYSNNINSYNETEKINSPKINIDFPLSGLSFITNHIDIKGTTTSAENKIDVVEVSISDYPVNVSRILFSKLNFIEISNSTVQWMHEFKIQHPGIYRILVHAVDSNCNENWKSTTIIVPFLSDDQNRITDLPNTSQKQFRIALVDDIFSQSVYNSKLYQFTDKYRQTREGSLITQNLDFLSSPIKKQATELDPYKEYSLTNGSLFRQTLNFSNPFAILVLNEIEKHILDNDMVTIINDEDIHQGRIFDSKGQNGYDLLIFTRQEFITQEYYNNLKKFVQNGGSALFINSDVFNSKIFYNDINKNVTLVEGKYWEFNGTHAKKTNIELPFFNQNKEFLGSNFLPSRIDDNITFKNNPFEYVHYKENYINKPNVTIIYDYGALLPRDNPFQGSIVATYETHYGKGKIIVFGIYTEKVFSNPSFQKFFQKILQTIIK